MKQAEHYGGEEVVPPKIPLRENESPQTNITSYDVVQLRVAECMRRIRELIAKLDGLPENTSLIIRTKISQQIRKEEQEAKLMMHEAKRLSLLEKRSHNFDTLNHFFQSTRQLIQEHYRGGLPTTNEGGKNKGQDHGDGNRFPSSALPSGGVFTPIDDVPDIRDNAEFDQFYLTTRRNDAFIDESLDRIYEGVQRLNGNATTIALELKTQKKMLDETEQKIDQVQGKLRKLNIKFRETIKKLDRPTIFVYIFCCFALVGVIVAIFFVVKY